MNEPIDQLSRERFISEPEQNFSVVAAAGSGKTRAITDRIVRIAQSKQAREWLPRLVVVAFTNRAADEMQQRARAEILRSGVPLDVLPAFNRAFFGTIHSFCVKLLEKHGHHLGLPPKFDLITNDDEVWNEFVQQQTVIGRSLSDENRAALLRHVQVRQLMELGRRGELNAIAPPSRNCPDANFRKVYERAAHGSALQKRLANELKRAAQIWHGSDDFVRWPTCTATAKEFVAAWRKAFTPLRKWIDECSLCVAAEVQRDYREFRLERGVLTYDDQVALALQLMRHAEVAAQIRRQNYRVILDEAQDTDPQQFSLLLEIARPPEAKGEWLETQAEHPRAGHFCMVGDFQQSIYRDRADLTRYRHIHETLVETGAAEALKFSVTFRLDTGQIELMNATFREILNNIDNQVEFVELSPRPDVLPGQVVRLDLKSDDVVPDARGKISEARKAEGGARELATWLRATDLQKLRAQSWRDVAILCPRKDWLQTLRRALREVGFAVQIQSEKELKGDGPAYAWFTALLTIMTEPRCGYEIVGVLREVFGISDHELAVFSFGHADRFQIETLTNHSDVVSNKLNLLTQIRLSIENVPLFTAATELVRQTQLRERLRVLPGEDFENPADELDALLAVAATAEAESATLIEFAESLRDHFTDQREVRPAALDAIQLITCQKAKGSEWQAVIVPFLARAVRPASPRYPRILRQGATGEVTVVLDKADVTQDIRNALELEEKQEMERLLYVALTRAQHTLVLAFDHQLFAKTNGEIHSSSQMNWLQADKGQPNSDAFMSADAAAVACDVTKAHQERKSREKSGEIETLPALGKIDNEAAVAHASIFIRTLNPSGLGTNEELPAETGADTRTDASGGLRQPAIANPATRYGLWWHDFIQQIPWNADASSWEKIFEANRPMSPDMARSAREWRLLRNHLSSSSDFRRRFMDRQLLVHPEMPFYWRMDGETCLEGVVDLAFFDRTARKWLILDWKTNRVPREKIDNLRTQYRPQIAAYWKAVTQMTPNAFGVDAGIYSTSTGQFIGYDPDELAHEWERLRTLPPEKIATEIAVDSEGPPVQLEFSALSDRARHE
jgi:ATP-dependent helicase/nuclease subunit A